MSAPTARDVADYAGLDLRAMPGLEQVTDAVVSRVATWTGREPDEWADHTRFGVIMLASRVYRRRHSPAGVEALGELGPVYVSRNDPDLAMMLGLGAYAQPQVG